MKTCHVCYCVDEGFEKYVIASMISLILNSKIKPKIHIIHNKLTDKKKLRFVEKRFKTRFKYYIVNDSKFYGLPVLGGYSVYYRLLIPELLSKKIKKVLYLDCDTLVENDLSKLFSIDLSKKALAAAENITKLKTDTKTLKKRLKIPINKGYFNSGVMLLNLDYFRKHDSSNKVISFMKKNVKKIIMHDQDGLNAVLKNDWIKIPTSYNYILNFNLSSLKNINPHIVHFAGLKPQMFNILNPGNIYCKKYYKYLSMTPLPKEEIEKKDTINYMKRLYDAFLRRFH